MNASNEAITVTSVSAVYDETEAVKNVSLSVTSGEIFSLLGPSGCGKTTLLRLLAGLHVPTSGTIHLNAQLVAGRGAFVAAEKRKIGMVFQDGALFPHLTVQDNVAFGLGRKKKDSSRVDEVLELVDMAGFKDRMPSTLSGGQAQRVALARSLAPSPSILLLDEPFSALDAGLRVSLRKDVKRILNDVGCTAVLVTHDQDEAYFLGDRVGVMRDGSIMQIGSPSEIYQNPVNEWVARFSGEANSIEGVVKAEGLVQTTLGVLPLATDSLSVDEDAKIKVLIRPEQLQLSAGSFGEIKDRQYFGHDVLYSVACESGLLEVRSASNQLQIGDSVDVTFIGEAVSCLRESKV